MWIVCVCVSISVWMWKLVCDCDRRARRVCAAGFTCMSFHDIEGVFSVTRNWSAVTRKVYSKDELS